MAFQAKAGGGGSGCGMLTKKVDVTEPVTAAERTLAAVVLTAERMRTVMEKRTLAAVVLTAERMRTVMEKRTLAAVVLTAERMRTVMEKRTLAAVDRTWVQKERLLVTGSQSEVSVVSMSAVEPVESVAVVLVCSMALSEISCLPPDTSGELRSSLI